MLSTVGILDISTSILIDPSINASQFLVLFMYSVVHDLLCSFFSNFISEHMQDLSWSSNVIRLSC